MPRSKHPWRRSASVGLVCLIATLTSGCPFAPVETLILDENDSGSEVSVGVGARLVLSLGENSSTGYVWEVVSLDTSVMEETGTTYRSDCTLGMVGCGGTKTWTFTTVSPGTTSLNMVNHRPWEDFDPIRTFDLTVTVTSGS